MANSGEGPSKRLGKLGSFGLGLRLGLELAAGALASSLSVVEWWREGFVLEDRRPN